MRLAKDGFGERPNGPSGTRPPDIVFAVTSLCM